MTKLQILHGQMEKKEKSINSIKVFLKNNKGTSIESEMKESITKYKAEYKLLETKFNELYNKFN